VIRVVVVWGVVVCAIPAAFGQGEEADVATSRRHFEAGVRAYDAGNYRLALDEFMTAQRLHRVPAFDYNIGRCYDLLGEPRLAIEHYERYLTTEPADAQPVRVRVAELKHGLWPAQSPERKRKRTLAIVLGVAGGVVLVGTVVAIGVTLGQPGPEYTPSGLGTTRVTP
jgi:hypothetical protein